jgi:biopolymer transport protein ExbB/TolQ
MILLTTGLVKINIYFTFFTTIIAFISLYMVIISFRRTKQLYNKEQYEKDQKQVKKYVDDEIIKLDLSVQKDINSIKDELLIRITHGHNTNKQSFETLTKLAIKDEDLRKEERKNMLDAINRLSCNIENLPAAIKEQITIHEKVFHKK